MAKDDKGHGSEGRGGKSMSKGPKYNASAVDKAISSAYRGKKPPTAKQRSVTHAILRGYGPRDT